MALYKISLDIVVKHSRLFSIVVQRATRPKSVKIVELPALAALEGASSVSNEKWTSLRKEILAARTQLRLSSPDVPIIQFCLTSKNLDLGKSYMKYLKENECDMSTAFIGKYFQLLYHNRHAITDADKNEISAMYDKLRIKHPLLDGITAEYCVLAISLTERWKETVELLEMIELSSIATPPSYSAIIVAAFNNGEPELGWKYFNKSVKSKKSPNSDAYIAYIDFCCKNFKEPDACVQEIGKLFNFFAKHDLIPYKHVMDHIKGTFETLGWIGNFVTLSSQGVCRNCNHKLEPLKLSENDFSHLSKTVLDKVLVGDNVYSRTSPYELKKFVNFINKTKPYNVVVDGLNVAYKTRNQGVHGAKQLASVVRYFLDKNQVVLVLGRKHMLQWERHSMDFIKKNSFLFLTDNLSADDPCLLYAALASGPEAKFVSSDLMRQHKFLLQDVSLENMFKRWQMSHQCFVDFKREKMSLVPPLNYLPVAQRGENCWHVPYRLLEAPLTESYEPPSHWLCLERCKSPC